MLGYENYWQKREVSPATEIACLVIAGVLVIPALAGFAIVKAAEWVRGKI